MVWHLLKSVGSFCNVGLSHLKTCFPSFYKDKSLECTVYNSVLLFMSKYTTAEVNQASGFLLKAVLPFQYTPLPIVMGKHFL